MIKENLKDKAYAVIKEKIINCEYAPNDFLDEALLIDEIGASRTPIREALNKLEQDQLVSIIPKRGVLVRDISPSNVREIFEVRELIEPYIIRTSAHLIDKRILRTFEEGFLKEARQDMRIEKFKCDDDLHKSLVQSSNNRYFIHIINQGQDQNNRIRILSGFGNNERMKETDIEHLTIVRNLLKDDYESAAQAMVVHILNAKDVAMRNIYGGNLAAKVF